MGCSNHPDEIHQTNKDISKDIQQNQTPIIDNSNYQIYSN